LLRALEVGSPIVVAVGLAALVLANARRPAITSPVGPDDRGINTMSAPRVPVRA